MAEINDHIAASEKTAASGIGDSPAIALFEREGERSTVGGNQPFLLNDPAAVWMVRRGKVDVFAVRMENGAASGRRHHILRVEAGQMVMGGETAGEGHIGMLAVGFSGTEVVKLPLVRLIAMGRDPETRPAVAALLHAWVERVSSGITDDIPPKAYERLAVHMETALSAGKNAGPAQGIVWVRPLRGAVRFLNKTPVDGQTLFPVSIRTWLHVSEESCLQAVSTETFLDSDPVWAGIHAFHRGVAACLALDLSQEEEAERRRLEIRTQVNRKALRQAVRRLTAVLDGDRGTPYLSSADGDPLVVACRWVAEAMGMEVVNPPAAASGLPESENPLADIARISKFRFRQVMLRGAWWRGDHGPLLGYIEETRQPVALLPASSRSYALADPAGGGRKPVTPALAATLSPFAYAFYRPLPGRALTGMDVFRLGMPGCKRDLGVVLLAGMAAGLLGLVTPWATGTLIDVVVPASQRGQLFQLSGVLTVCALSVALFNIVKGIALLRVEGRMNMNIQAAVWDRLLNLPMSFFRRYLAGDLVMRAMGINQIRRVISGIVIATLLSSLFSVFHFLLLFYYAWKLALLAVGLSVVLVGITLAVSFCRLHYERQLADIEGAVSGMVLQFIAGITKLRVAGAESRAFAVWSERFSHKRQVAFKAGTTQNYLEAVNAVFPVLASMAVYGFAFDLIQEALKAGADPLSTGDFLAFNASFSTFLAAALEMGLALIAALSVVPLYHRARPILETLPEVSAVKAHPGELKGDIEVNQVSFGYIEDGPTILRNVSLHARPGEYIAVVGPSGSGKSTLLRLLMGFERPALGSIYYDGRDLADLDVGEVRRQIGAVVQYSKLTSGSIFHNIVGSAPFTLEEAWEAARLAGFDRDIEEMPMGMHTLIDAEGSTLSGGQRQRLMIARAIVKRPRILLFDEATSALDNQTQAAVSRSLDRLRATRVVIAHRLSTILRADRIYVLQQGEIVQTGTYETLMRQPGPFTELARRQLV